MNRFKINKYLLLISMVFIALGVIAWTTNPGSILYTGEVVFQGPVTTTGAVDLSGSTTTLGTIGTGVGTNLTALNGENIQDDTIDDDSIDFSDVTAADITMTDAGAITASGLITGSAGVTVSTGQDIILGANTLNSGDLIDGEQIADDTIDDDSIDFSDVTGADLTLTDCGAVTGTTITGNVYAFATASYAFATTTANDAYDVAAKSMIFLDSSSFAGTIGGFTNGVAGQQLFISVKDATETITLENEEGGGNQDMYLDGAGDVTLNVNEGVHLVCDGTNWYEINR